jgi:hypothetical protein
METPFREKDLPFSSDRVIREVRTQFRSAHNRGESQKSEWF